MVWEAHHEYKYPQPNPVTSNLAPRHNSLDNCPSKGSKFNEIKNDVPGQKSAHKSFAFKILTANSFALRILRGKSC
jgi:hypothetical protein